jgi:sRNA-binding protein
MCTPLIPIADVIGPHRARQWEVAEQEIRERAAEQHSGRKAERQATREYLAAARKAGLARRHREKEQRMAEKTTRDPFGPWLNGFSYEQAFDGSTWKIKRGEDFEQAPATVVVKLRAEFERRYGALDVKVDGEFIHVRRLAPTKDRP